MANIFDVAGEAGVSHQTVSRVVNGDANVRPATRAKVDAAIRKLNYRPSAAARALASRKTRALGLISTGGPLFGPSSTLQGFDVAARQAGYQVSIASVPPDDAGLAGAADAAGSDAAGAASTRFGEGMRAAVDALLGQNVEAIVLIAPDDSSMEAIRGIDLRGVPLVAADALAEAGLVSVAFDQHAGALLATRHLASLGHERIAHLGGPVAWNDARERERGWRDALAELGLPEGPLYRGDWTADSGYAIGAELPSDVTAVFCANDPSALGLMHALADRGISVPDRVSVVGFDDVPESAHFFPPLTTVRQDFTALGRRIMLTVEGLLAPGDAEPLPPLDPSLVVRASTGPRAA